jgi:hypothetical protein
MEGLLSPCVVYGVRIYLLNGTAIPKTRKPNRSECELPKQTPLK